VKKMVDILEMARKTKKAGVNKDTIRIAFDLTHSEHQKVVEFCNRHNLSIGKLAKVLLLQFLEQQMEKPMRK
jgi:hypothetical protein